jgi:hypothetical protein
MFEIGTTSFLGVEMGELRAKLTNYEIERDA